MMLVAICWYTTLRTGKINDLGSCVSNSFEDFALIRRYLPSYLYVKQDCTTVPIQLTPLS